MERMTLRDNTTVDYLALNSGDSSEPENTTSLNAEPEASTTETTTEVTPPHDIQLEIAQLQAEKALLEEGRRQREFITLRDTLKQQCATLRASEAAGTPITTNTLNNNTQLPPPPETQTTTQKSNNITVRELRTLSNLSSQADDQLARYGLDYTEATAEQRNPQYNNGKEQTVKQFPVGPSSERIGLLATGIAPSTTNISSGRDIRVKDSVVRQLHWPHTRLNYTFYNSGIPYNKLEPAILVAGELGVLLIVPEEERIARNKLLQRLMYFSQDYTWPATRAFHETVLSEIERGTREWSNDDYRDIESAVLYRNPIITTYYNKPTNNSQATRQQTRRFFCLDYNRTRCTHAGEHNAMVGSTMQTVEHFCSTCWRRGRNVNEHPESSTECPHHK